MDAPSSDTSGPKVLAVVSCGQSKQDLDPGETVPARELYTSSVHSCKDRYGRNSHGYRILSAKYGIVHPEDELPYYDKTIGDMSDEEVTDWATDALTDLTELTLREGYDAIVFIGSKDYIRSLSSGFRLLDADVLAPWQTEDYVTGVGRGMAWCNDESNWPVNVRSVEEIGKVVNESETLTVPEDLFERLEGDDFVRDGAEKLARRGDRLGAVARCILSISNGEEPDDEDLDEARLEHIETVHGL